MTTKPLLAVVTCEKFKHRADAQRATWVPLVGDHATVKFFLAKQDRDPSPDEVFLDVPDSYEHLPLKTQAAVKWALENGFDHFVKLDDDTLIMPDRLFAAIPPQDYVGFMNATMPKPWCSGFAYHLSERAMRIVADAPIPQDEWAEDRFVGGALYDHGIHPMHDGRYALILRHWRVNDYRTVIAVCDCNVPPIPMHELLGLCAQGYNPPPEPTAPVRRPRPTSLARRQGLKTDAR